MGMPQIDGERLWASLLALAECGATAKGGVNRQALSAEEHAAWRLVIGWATDAGLIASTDACGNLFLTLPGTDPDALPILTGSHLDSQPTGGRFDGVYGVAAALEALIALAHSAVRPVCDVIAVAWMNEEGSRFAPGMMGSMAFAGVMPMTEIQAVRDAQGMSVGQALAEQLALFADLPQRSLGFPLAAYLEAHIEQGPILEARQKVIGMVTGIQGKKTWEITVTGMEGHAGTLAMADREDALASFSRIAQRLYEEVGGHDTLVKFTIGRLRVEPNAPSVVPAKVVFSIDLRHPENPVLEHLGELLVTICNEQTAPCKVSVKPLVDAPSNLFDDRLQSCIESSARHRGIPSMHLLSAAGHDARYMAPLCPSAMIFIPCKGGVSHAEHEWAEPAHVAAGAQVLLDTLLVLCTAAAPGNNCEVNSER
jgi:N-carbamoyl-L-amino-acid hydrolase